MSDTPALIVSQILLLLQAIRISKPLASHYHKVSRETEYSTLILSSLITFGALSATHHTFVSISDRYFGNFPPIISFLDSLFLFLSVELTRFFVNKTHKPEPKTSPNWDLDQFFRYISVYRYSLIPYALSGLLLRLITNNISQ